MFLYHVNSYESRNFSKTEAKISMNMAKFLNCITFKLWEIEVPSKVIEIVRHEGDELHKTFEHHDLSLGFKFMADMMNRTFFLITVLVEIVAFSATILTAIPTGNSSRLAILKGLEENHLRANRSNYMNFFKTGVTGCIPKSFSLSPRSSDNMYIKVT